MPRSRLGVLVCLTLAWAARVPAAEPPGLAPIVEQFDRLAVGNAVGVTGLRLADAHLTCVLESGSAAPVLAGEAIVGLYFEGRGTLTYVSAEPIEAPVVLFDLKKGTSLIPRKTDEGIVVGDDFARLLWLAQGAELPRLTGSPASPLADGFAKQREKFRRSFAPPLSHHFALQRLNDAAAPMVWVEADGGKEDLVCVRDGIDDPAQALILLRGSESNDPQMRKFLWPVALSVQPSGRDPRDPPRPLFLLTDVGIDLEASGGREAKLTVVETIVPMDRTLHALRFALDRIVYAASGVNLGTRTERLQKVVDDAGRSLAFDHRNDDLVVELAEAAPAGKPIRLRFEIDGDFLVRPGGDSYWELGVWSWFPQPPLDGQFYTFHTKVRVPRPFVPFSPGVTVRRAVEGGDNVLETRIDKPIQFGVILAGDYTMSEEVRNGVTIRVATYALNNPRGMKQLTNLADSIIAYYQEFLGPFPFTEFNILEINDYGFGQAPPGTMFITKEAFNPLNGDMTQLFSQGINERFAHEIAHQYWGTVVKMPSDEEQWITESFAEYCAALFLKAYRDPGVYKRLVKQWQNRAGIATAAAPIALANRVYLASDRRMRFEIRTGLLYDKGPLLLAALHKELGDETFLTFLKSYQKSFAWKFGSTKTMAALLQFMTRKDYMPFFDAYYWGTAMPKD